MEKAESLTIEILEENYPLLLEGTAPRYPQNHNDATYCSRRKPEDGLINWHATNVEIYNAIRAQTHPYPGAFCYVRGVKNSMYGNQECFHKSIMEFRD